MPDVEDPSEERGDETPPSGSSRTEGPESVGAPQGDELLDLTKPSGGEDRVELREAPPYSPQWAKIILPIASTLLALIASVMLLPFLIIATVDKETAALAIDWAKTVLPPVVGFGGALVGYYFGTRGAQGGGPSEE